MALWTCPECGRRFGRTGQGHVCAPGMSVEEYLATAPPHERPVAETLLDHVAGLPEAYVEPVQVGLFFKRRRSFAQARTMTRWVALWVGLPRVVHEPAPDRKVEHTGGRYWHVFNVTAPVPQELLDLVSEAYETDAP